MDEIKKHIQIPEIKGGLDRAFHAKGHNESRIEDAFTKATKDGKLFLFGFSYHQQGV